MMNVLKQKSRSARLRNNRSLLRALAKEVQKSGVKWSRVMAIGSSILVDMGTNLRVFPKGISPRAAGWVGGRAFDLASRLKGLSNTHRLLLDELCKSNRQKEDMMGSLSGVDIITSDKAKVADEVKAEQ
jgi:hypothetical protein